MRVALLGQICLGFHQTRCDTNGDDLLKSILIQRISIFKNKFSKHSSLIPKTSTLNYKTNNKSIRAISNKCLMIKVNEYEKEFSYTRRSR